MKLASNNKMGKLLDNSSAPSKKQQSKKSQLTNTKKENETNKSKSASSNEPGLLHLNHFGKIGYRVANHVQSAW